jgi:integrase
VLRKPWEEVDLVKPPKGQRLPDILTVAEVQALIQGTYTLSYQVFFFTLYSLGLRLGEGLSLRVGDIDAVRQRVHVRDAKGNKDRLVPLPRATLELLRRFWRVHRHPQLLFPNRRGGLQAAAQARTPLDRGGVQLAMRKVIESRGIKKRSPRTVFAIASPRT